MFVSNWPNAIAHVDADCFYASCEQLRRPDLKGKPLCILSSQDACIVAKTYEAKAAGITTGMTIWDAKKLLPNAIFLSADFRYYGQVSDKLFSTLRRFSPIIEEYSIDEAFMDMMGLRSLYRKPYQKIADDIREIIHQEVGITVSIGISVTRTLAKIASEYNKPNGTTIVGGRRINDFLQHVSVRDIPGVGHNREALLTTFGIHTALDFANSKEHDIKKLLGKAGTDLWHELNGTAVYQVEAELKLPKSIARTASLGQITQDKAIIYAHLTRHAMRLSKELIEKSLASKRLTVFLTLKSFDRQATTVQLPYPTADYFLLMEEMSKMVEHLFDSSQMYRACGMVATDIDIRQSGSFDMFQQAEQQLEDKHLKLLKTVHRVNQKYGTDMLFICSAIKKTEQMKHMRFKYPMLECF